MRRVGDDVETERGLKSLSCARDPAASTRSKSKMRKTITVKIEKKHWDAALKSAWMSGEEMLIHDNKCPVAQALYEKISTPPHVNGSLVTISGKQYTLDESGSNF